MRSHKSKTRCRRGAAAVEMAMVTPFIVLVFCGVVELGQYVNVAQSISNASREGARVASRNETKTAAAVQTAVQNYLYGYGSIPPSAITVSVTRSDGGSICSGLDEIPSGDGVAVAVSARFDAIRWTNLFQLFTNSHIYKKAVMRRE